VPWEYQSQRPDTDHFNRDYKPESARGGTQICLLDPQNESITALTADESGVWDFRCNESSDGRYVVFCRAATGEAPAVWVMDRDGNKARRLTQGVDDLGADHPRWLPQAK
jgi:TolB protein